MTESSGNEYLRLVDAITQAEILVAPLPPSDPEACVVCLGHEVNRPFDDCFRCGHSGALPVPITAISLSDYKGTDQQLYHLIKSYKGEGYAPAVREMAAQRLGAIVSEFFERHSGCLHAQLGGPWDICATIPSTRPDRQGRVHPLHTLLERLPTAVPGLQSALEYSGGSEPKPRQARQGVFSASTDLEGRRVLLVEDLAVSAGNLMSGVLAVKSAGARAVAGLVIARGVMTDSDERRATYRRAKKVGFDWSTCARHV